MKEGENNMYNMSNMYNMYSKLKATSVDHNLLSPIHVEPVDYWLLLLWIAGELV